jgi:alpha-galactosidase
VVNTGKLPEGLPHLVERVNAAGTGFGIWFEPEMISPDSDLYRAHPDWCLHVPGRRRTQGRTQLILDMSRTDIQDWLVETLSGILSSAPFQYVKWDFNRSLTEIGSVDLPADQQRETAHRFMLGTYRVMEQLTSRFPEILFEGCSGGGARFDPGLLHYMPQIWTSDDSDAVERLKIQYGTSIVYPFSTMGAHVSAVPNHQCGRITPLSFRGHAALTGAFGYELDLEKLTDDEKAEVAVQTAQYRKWAHLPAQGDLYRLRSPFEGNDAAWSFVMPDRAEALALHFRVLARPNPEPDRLRLEGLCPDAVYEVTRYEGTAQAGAPVSLSGARLMRFGLHIPFGQGDFVSTLWHLRQVDGV